MFIPNFQPRYIWLPTFLLLITAFAAACGANDNILKSGKDAPANGNSNSPSAQMSPVEREVAAMREANFDWIYAIKRRDGRVLDKDDRQAIKVFASDINRRTVSSDETAVVLGTNAYIGDENLNGLKLKFDVLDFSKPDAVKPSPTPTAANANSSSNKTGDKPQANTKK